MSGAELRAWMVAHQYSVRTLADALGLNASTVQRYRDAPIVPPVVALALVGLTRE